MSKFKKVITFFNPFSTSIRSVGKGIERNKKTLSDIKNKIDNIKGLEKNSDVSYWIEKNKFNNEDIRKSYKIYSILSYVMFFVSAYCVFNTLYSIASEGFRLYTIDYLISIPMMLTLHWSFLYKCYCLKNLKTPAKRLSIYKKISNVFPDINY